MAINTPALLNKIRANASTLYQERIPVATRENIASIGNLITSDEYESQKNEWLDAFINVIGKTIASSKMAKNHLAVFKGEKFEYGQDIQEYFVDMAKASGYDPDSGADLLFSIANPTVDSIYHRKDRRYKFEVTIYDNQIKAAFHSPAGMNTLVGMIVQSLYSGDKYDEYIQTKELLASYQAMYFDMPVTELTDRDTAKEFSRAIQQKSIDLTFMNDEHNAKGKLQFSDLSDQVLLLHKDIKPLMNTELLAWAYNDGKFNPETQVIIVDDFGSMADTYAILLDKNIFRIHDVEYKLLSQANPGNMSRKYFLHHWALMSMSSFHQAVRFVGTPATV